VLRRRGEECIVGHPEQVFLAENKTTAIIDVTDRIHILDVDQITKLAIPRRDLARQKAKSS
jgi:hypothetical protein